jgi:hypothetical protein
MSNNKDDVEDQEWIDIKHWGMFPGISAPDTPPEDKKEKLPTFKDTPKTFGSDVWKGKK